jgi:hypothetical protein
MLQKITQSFIKDFRSYLGGNECGHIIKAKYIDDQMLENEEPGAMELGAYFEFIAFGNLPKDGKTPVPLYMQSKDIVAKIEANTKAGKDPHDGLEVKHMYAEYRKAHVAADQIKAYLKLMGLQVIGKGEKITKSGVIDGSEEPMEFEGTLDLRVRTTKKLKFSNGFTWNIGNEFIIDLKYSGLIGDHVPWKNKHGWVWSPVQREYHGTQAKQYQYLSDMMVYFWVTQSNQKEGDLPNMKLFRAEVSEAQILAHVVEGKYLYKQFKFHSGTGFVARPSLQKCNECPLRDTCKDRQLYPSVEVIDLTVE